MPATLAPCIQCARHVRRDAPACPFCAAPLGAASAEPACSERGIEAAARRSRAALAAFGAATTLLGCSGAGTPPPEPAPMVSQPTASAAASTQPSAEPAPSVTPRPGGQGMIMTRYGAPPTPADFDV